jgi:streptomycin 6-kinase
VTVFVVTPELAATVERLGAEGEAWLARLPGIVEGCERRWGATVGPPFQPGGFVSYAAPATLEDGTEAVLKISYPEWETINEGAALRFYDGDGAARLLAEAPEQTALLLERLRPGTSLWSLRDEDEANAIAAGVLRRLWRPVAQDGDHPFELLADHAARWSVSVREELERPVPTSLSAVVADGGGSSTRPGGGAPRITSRTSSSTMAIPRSIAASCRRTRPA